MQAAIPFDPADLLPALSALGLCLVALGGCRVALSPPAPPRGSGLALLLASLLALPFSAWAGACAGAAPFLRGAAEWSQLLAPWTAGHAFVVAALALVALAQPPGRGANPDFAGVAATFAEWASLARRSGERMVLPALSAPALLLGGAGGLLLLLVAWAALAMTEALAEAAAP